MTPNYPHKNTGVAHLRAYQYIILFFDTLKVLWKKYVLHVFALRNFLLPELPFLVQNDYYLKSVILTTDYDYHFSLLFRFYAPNVSNTYV